MDVLGTYTRGFGEGAGYVSLPYYRHRMASVLGADPYPGTFNVRVSRHDVARLRRLASDAGVRIEPCGKLGGVWMYPCAVNGRPAWLVFPDKSRHERHLELVAPYRISEALGVIPGDKVKVSVWGPEVWPVAVSIWRTLRRP